VWVTPQEHEFIRKSGDMDFCKLFTGIRYEEYGFENGPYLGFPSSHDVYGDGSIVVVPAPGHTPGSVIVFVTLPAVVLLSARIFFFIHRSCYRFRKLHVP